MAAEYYESSSGQVRAEREHGSIEGTLHQRRTATDAEYGACPDKRRAFRAR
jgi:hypothetical protein